MSRLGRDLNKVIILDNSPMSYVFHPDNAVGCKSWFDDMNDTELRDLIPYFEQLSKVDSVYSILKESNKDIAQRINMWHNHSPSQTQSQQQQQQLRRVSNSGKLDNFDDNQQVPIQKSNDSPQHLSTVLCDNNNISSANNTQSSINL